MRSFAFPFVLSLVAAPVGAQLAPSDPAAAAAGLVAPDAAVPTAPPAAVPAPMPAAGAPARDAAVGLRPAPTPAFDLAAEARAAAPRRKGYGRDVALMATGGAFVVLGLLAGDTAGGLLVVSGAALGGVGLYNFLR